MTKELIGLVIAVVLLMLAMRMLFSEIDGRTAAKRMNLAYFLSFDKKFTYTRIGTTLFTLVLCVVLFGGIDLRTKEGLILLAIFAAIGMVADFVSSYLYHFYGRYRFRDKINEAKAYVTSLKKRVAQPFDSDDVYLLEPQYDFTEVTERYLLPEDHMACFSADGGEWLSALPRYSQITFLVDSHTSEAALRFADTPVRVTTLTNDKRYPFKDQKIDTLVFYNENFNPKEANRVLKDGGTLVINQLGSENLVELYAFTNPRLFRNQWNLNFLKEGLITQGYQILDGQEERGEIRFRNIAAFYQYAKDMTILKMDQIEDFINQYFFIDQMIQKNGFFAMKTHRFYAVARKNG